MGKYTNKSVKEQTSSTQKSKTPLAAPPRPIQEIPHSSRPSTGNTPAHADIAKRAYEIYLERGCPQGQNEEIWRQAEQELVNRSLASFLSR